MYEQLQSCKNIYDMLYFKDLSCNEKYVYLMKKINMYLGIYCIYHMIYK